MTKIFDGLYGYEIVMMVGGALVLLVGVILGIAGYLKGKSQTLPLSMIVLSIVMIGFPAYSTIEISGDGVKLGKATHELQQDPTSPQKRQEVETLSAKLSKRPIQDPNTVTTIAQAQIALGDNAAAQANVNKVLSAAPQNPAALELKGRLDLDRNLEQLTAQVEKDPSNEAAKSQLAAAVNQAGSMAIASPTTIANVAKAHAALGNTAKARENLDKVLKINPKFAPALQLKNRLQ